MKSSMDWLERLGSVAWWAFTQPTTRATRAIAALFPEAATLVRDGLRGRPGGSAGHLLADMRGDVPVPAAPGPAGRRPSLSAYCLRRQA